MYRFGEPSILNALVGCDVLQICLGEFETQLRFSNASLSMEGRYVHEVISENRENEQARSSSGPNELHRLVGKSITDVRVMSPESAELFFSNGDILRLIDDSDEYESFVLNFGGKFIVV
jgi:hypothetical protein